MTTFLQFHLLTSYPPANLNRDDTGRPKTAQFGGATRLRVSSQSLKRAWRTSDVFETSLKDHLGKRTQRLGQEVEKHLLAQDVEPAKARGVALKVARLFGAPETDKKKPETYIRQLAFVSPEEKAKALALAERLAEEDAEVEAGAVLSRTDTAVDIAMFGRMLADNPDFNREAATQVAHAITTHKAPVEDDYYTAVDDLKKPSEDAGAGFVGEAGFGSGLFYLYVCIDRDLLARNLGGDAGLAGDGIAALVEAAATVAPKGKQASFASRARADFLMVEQGETAPRTLATAFLKPIQGGRDGVLIESVAALKAQREALARAYGDATAASVMDVPGGEGTLKDAIAFARGGL